MIPVCPYHIRRSRDGQCGELLLKLEGRDSAFIIHLSLEQARLLAVEMRGLATDHCPQHHLTCSVLQALSTGISGVILKGLDRGLVMGTLRLEAETGFIDVEADVAAALGMAIHLGLPIFMEGSHALSQDELVAIQGPADSPSGVQIPDAFLKVIEGLDFPRTAMDSPPANVFPPLQWGHWGLCPSQVGTSSPVWPGRRIGPGKPPVPRL
jgi:bifunctional DNase/RNase